MRKGGVHGYKSFSLSVNHQIQWDVMLAQQHNPGELLFFSDVQVFGTYPTFVQNYWQENNFPLKWWKGMRKSFSNTHSGFCLFSYYMSMIETKMKKIGKKLAEI